MLLPPSAWNYLVSLYGTVPDCPIYRRVLVPVPSASRSQRKRQQQQDNRHPHHHHHPQGTTASVVVTATGGAGSGAGAGAGAAVAAKDAAVVVEGDEPEPQPSPRKTPRSKRSSGATATCSTRDTDGSVDADADADVRLTVELYPPEFDVWRCASSGQPIRASSKRVCISNTADAATMLHTVCTELGEDSHQCRLWAQPVSGVSEWLLLSPAPAPTTASSSTTTTSERHASDLIGQRLMLESPLAVPRRHRKRHRRHPTRGRHLQAPQGMMLPRAGLKQGAEFREFEKGDPVDLQDTRGVWFPGHIVAVYTDVGEPGTTQVVAKYDKYAFTETLPAGSTRLQPVGVCTEAREARAPPSGCSGLMNLGNTCYMNSVLQSLATTPLLSQYALRGSMRADVNPGNPMGSHGRMVKGFVRLLTSMMASSSRGAPVVDPWPFKSTVDRVLPQFVGFEQHDAQELLGALLGALHEDLNQAEAYKVHEEEVLDPPSSHAASATPVTPVVDADASESDGSDAGSDVDVIVQPGTGSSQAARAPTPPRQRDGAGGATAAAVRNHGSDGVRPATTMARSGTATPAHAPRQPRRPRTASGSSSSAPSPRLQRSPSSVGRPQLTPLSLPMASPSQVPVALVGNRVGRSMSGRDLDIYRTEDATRGGQGWLQQLRVAEGAWEAHIARNRSAIIDLFHVQTEWGGLLPHSHV